MIFLIAIIMTLGAFVLYLISEVRYYKKTAKEYMDLHAQEARYNVDLIKRMDAWNETINEIKDPAGLDSHWQKMYEEEIEKIKSEQP